MPIPIRLTRGLATILDLLQAQRLLRLDSFARSCDAFIEDARRRAQVGGQKAVAAQVLHLHAWTLLGTVWFLVVFLPAMVVMAIVHEPAILLALVIIASVGGVNSLLATVAPLGIGRMPLRPAVVNAGWLAAVVVVVLVLGIAFL